MIVVFMDQLSWLGSEACAARAAKQQTLRNPTPMMIVRSFMVTPLNELVRYDAGRPVDPETATERTGGRRARPGHPTFVLHFDPPVKGVQASRPNPMRCTTIPGSRGPVFQLGNSLRSAATSSFRAIDSTSFFGP